MVGAEASNDIIRKPMEAFRSRNPLLAAILHSPLQETDHEFMDIADLATLLAAERGVGGGGAGGGGSGNATPQRAATPYSPGMAGGGGGDEKDIPQQPTTEEAGGGAGGEGKSEEGGSGVAFSSPALSLGSGLGSSSDSSHSLFSIFIRDVLRLSQTLRAYESVYSKRVDGERVSASRLSELSMQMAMAREEMTNLLEMKEENKLLQGKIEEILKEKDSLEKEKRRAIEEGEALQKEMESLRMERGKKEKDYDEEIGRLTQLNESNIQTAADRMDQLKKDYEGKMQREKEKYDLLTKENQTAAQQWMEKSTELNKSIEELKSQLSNLTTASTDLQSKYSKLEMEKKREATDYKSQLDALNATLKAEGEAAKERELEWKHWLEARDLTIKSLEDRSESFRKEMEMVRGRDKERYETVLREKRGVEGQLADTQTTLETMKKELEEKENQIEEQKKKIEKLEKVDAEKKKEMDALKAERETLKAQIRELNDLFNEKTALLEEKNTEILSLKTTHQGRLDQLKKDYDFQKEKTTTQQVDAILREKEEIERGWGEARETWKKELENVKQKEKIRYEQLWNEKKAIDELILVSNAENEKLKAAMEEAVAREAEKSLRLIKLETERKKEVGFFQSEIEKYKKQLEEEGEMHRAEESRIDGLVRAMEEQRITADHKIEAGKKEYESNLKREKEKVEGIQREKIALEEALAAATQQVEGLRVALAAAEGVANEKGEKSIRLEMENKKLLGEYNRKTEEMKKFLGESGERERGLREQLEMSEKRAEEARERSDTQMDILKRESEEIRRKSREKVENLTREKKFLEEKNFELQREIERGKGEAEEWRDRAREAEGGREAAKSMIEKFKAQRSEEMKEILKISEGLKTENRKWKERAAELEEEVRGGNERIEMMKKMMEIAKNDEIKEKKLIKNIAEIMDALGEAIYPSSSSPAPPQADRQEILASIERVLAHAVNAATPTIVASQLEVHVGKLLQTLPHYQAGKAGGGDQKAVHDRMVKLVAASMTAVHQRLAAQQAYHHHAEDLRLIASLEKEIRGMRRDMEDKDSMISELGSRVEEVIDSKRMLARQSAQELKRMRMEMLSVLGRRGPSMDGSGSGADQNLPASPSLNTNQNANMEHNDPKNCRIM